MSGIYKKIDERIIRTLREIVGEEYVLTERNDIEPYSHDETEDLKFFPEVVVKPNSAHDISNVLKLCDSERIPVTPRGAGTGLSGGALPVFGGIVLSLERMNRIIEIDTENLMAVVEPGIVTETFQNEVERIGLFYPPDPASRGSCVLGGNVAECAGGPRALKYGVTKDYVYGVEAVLASGEIMNTGGKVLKNVSGYNLTQILIGSEGTLAIITKIILKLLPLPKFKMTLLAPFRSLDSAAKVVTKIFHAKVIPCALEFMEKSAVKAAEEKLEKSFPHSDAEALLLIELDGNNEKQLEEDSYIIGEICEEFGSSDIFVADSIEKQKYLWDMRRSIGEAVKSISAYKEEDTVVPRNKLPELVLKVKEICEKYKITAICYGHAGDGNIHVNIIKKNISQEIWDKVLPCAIKEIFTEVVRLGGTISGEHGIGYSQREYLPIGLGETEIRLMKEIKKVFDPNNILNPGKIFLI